MRDFQWFIMTGLAKRRPGVVGDNTGVKQGPNQEDMHGALMGFTLLARLFP